MKKIIFILTSLTLSLSGQVTTVVKSDEKGTLLKYDGDTSKTKYDNKKAIRSVKKENRDVSLIKLIATPEKYQGQVIQVMGYLSLDFEGRAIYLHKEDYNHSLCSNAFSVQFSPDFEKIKNIAAYDKKYVVIIGTFNSGPSGHMGTYPGSLTNITRLDFWGFKKDEKED